MVRTSSSSTSLVACALVFFLLGAVAAVAYMVNYGYRFGKAGDASGEVEPAPSGPSNRDQLTTMITRLDQYTTKPLFVELSAEQKKELQKQLEGLEELEVVSDEDAKAKVESLLDILKDKKDFLDVTGLSRGRRARVGGGGTAAVPPPNPFAQGGPGKSLKSLRVSLSK